MSVYFEITPKGFDAKGKYGVERALYVAETTGKYNCIIPTSEAGVNVGWCLEYDGKYYELRTDNKLVFRCCGRDNIKRYFDENIPEFGVINM